mmetsp:Transcript_11440/g.36317  ORF Transcript_11440/g.36317 Transcript_11440/m.36317 type:complete len:222 (+) Transcript_11440:27-692(+)|eukprot:CAMPEP_0197388118 /NCGR_PEP_ID=MMETSP1165-20131217/897_1 /TAXON_ID=284809 /ORGANISM="Chrysocystis fragilis, Strain CCMP3189" /LENGTH=221 /DNA_ID=CAMNT_0042913457 /DNA_START=27 /DNA_END=692 /DNA_ORIENTATION=+
MSRLIWLVPLLAQASSEVVDGRGGAEVVDGTGGANTRGLESHDRPHETTSSTSNRLRGSLFQTQSTGYDDPASPDDIHLDDEIMFFGDYYYDDADDFHYGAVERTFSLPGGGPLATGCFELTLFDTNGDGWNGNAYSILTDDGRELVSGTMVDGSTRVDTICVPPATLPTCLNIVVTLGTCCDSESSWAIDGVVTGGADSTAEFYLTRSAVLPACPNSRET